MNDRRLARNTVYNLTGQVVPLLAAVVAIPILIRELGTSRFGILTLAWTAIGYFSLFDFGLSRAVTHAVAVRLGAGETDDLGALSWTAILLMFCLGIVGGVLLAALSPLLVDHVLNTPPDLQTESLHAFYLIAASLPWMVVTGGFRGLLEAHQEFGVATLLRIPLAAFTFVAPLFVLPFSHRLEPTVGILVVGRLLMCVVHLIVCWRWFPFLRTGIAVRRDSARSLLAFGGWTTVSNIVSPLMVQLDRFFIGALLPIADVTYYVTPYELVNRLLIIPQSLLAVLFPAFASTYVTDRRRTVVLFERGTRVVLVAVFPVVLVMAVLAHEGLTLWVGRDVASHSVIVLQWLALGIFINCAGQTSFFVLQGIGRPDITARLHMIELPLYCAGLWYFGRTFGLPGVAAAWTLRATLDAVALAVFAIRNIPDAAPDVFAAARTLAVMLLCVAAGYAIHTTSGRIVYLAITLTAFGIITWLWIIQPGERMALLGWLRSRRPGSELPDVVR